MLLHLYFVQHILVTECSQNGLEHPSVDISLEDSSGILVDGFERTYDGKLKCRYCNYATRGTARLIEHIRIHTGMFSEFIPQITVIYVT